jgi:hypothetical protein
MADEPLQTDVYLTKEQIEWVKLAIHRDMIYQDETEPIDWKYKVMDRLDYAQRKFKFCNECWTHWVARWSDDTHTCPPKEEE